MLVAVVLVVVMLVAVMLVAVMLVAYNKRRSRVSLASLILTAARSKVARAMAWSWPSDETSIMR